MRRQFDSDPRHQRTLDDIIEHSRHTLSIGSIMRKDRNKALSLRLGGKSYTEISKLLGVPKSTLSGWLSGVSLSEQASRRIRKRVHSGSLKGLLARNRRQTHLAIQRMRYQNKVASGEIGSISLEELKLIGAALYWAEGYKRPIVVGGRQRTYHPVSLTNSDARLVLMFLRFLREVCGVLDESITADVRIYEHMNTEMVVKYWQRLTRIPKHNFGKVYYGVSRSSKGKRPFNRLPYGAIQIRVNDTALFHKIMGWINGLTLQAT